MRQGADKFVAGGNYICPSAKSQKSKGKSVEPIFQISKSKVPTFCLLIFAF
jgi:hypothetical protein